MLSLPFFCSRRRSVGGLTDARGSFVYDTLQHERQAPDYSCRGNSSNNQAHKTTTEYPYKDQKQSLNDSWQLKGFKGVFQGSICSTELAEISRMPCTTGQHRGRFSVDLGEVRKFVVLIESGISPTDKNTAFNKQ